MRIQKVKVLDDDPNIRATYADTVIDADLDPVPEELPLLGQLSDYLDRPLGADAAITDFNLFSTGYAAFSGAELVAAWYARGYPAVLCTRYEKVHIDQIRPYRDRIPVLLKPEELHADAVLPALETCLREIRGEPTDVRRGWRTQVHFVSNADGGTFLAEVPAWGSEIVRLPKEMLPAELAAVASLDYRCHARVNLAAERSEDLYFTDWQFGD